MFALSIVATVISKYPPLAYNIGVHGTFRVLLAVSFVLSGAAHFYAPLYAFYESMVFLPFKGFWIYSTGVAMIGSGLSLLYEPTRIAAAEAIMAILVVVFPGNVACVVMKKPRKVVFGGSLTAAVARLPLQITLISWASWIAETP
jgi:uncharacterized membrane protein